MPVVVFVGKQVGREGMGLGLFGGGYGAAQIAITGSSWFPTGWRGVELLALLGVAKIVATSLTVGSGGSAGDFGPSLVIGGIFGGAFGRAAQLLLHDPRIDPGAFALVGMGTFYGGLAHVPIASLVMVCELAGSYDLLVPLMLANGIAFIALRSRSLYHAQRGSWRDSPAHHDELVRDVLRDMRVGACVVRDRPYVAFERATRADEVIRRVAEGGWQDVFPVLSEDRKVVGVITTDVLRTAAQEPEIARIAIADDLMLPPSSSARARTSASRSTFSSCAGPARSSSSTTSSASSGSSTKPRSRSSIAPPRPVAARSRRAGDGRPMTASATSRDSALALLRELGSEAMSFLALEPQMRPGSQKARTRERVRRLRRHRKRLGRRGCTDRRAVEALGGSERVRSRREGRRPSRLLLRNRATRSSEGFAYFLLGEQPSWSPAEWPAILARHRRLREQLRRARAKGVRVRKVLASELSPGSVLRVACEALAREWLEFRRMPPMRFVVALEPFVFPDEHRYFVAERGDDVVAFLSAVPVYATRGWLVEDLPRTRRAPNGTIEMLIDAMMRDAAKSESASAFLGSCVGPCVSPCVTNGLAPLTGPVSASFRLARFVGRPFYDFRGLRSFKERLRPSSWQSVWLAFPRSEMAALHVVESLRAFAGGSLVVFGLRTLGMLGLHPSGPPWALALPLVPWTLLLAVVAISGRADLLGYSAGVLLAWVVFDALLFAQLVRSAARPRPRRLLGSDVLAVVDAALSLHHLAVHGFGNTAVASTLRGVATFAPCMGAIVLTWATAQAAQRAKDTRYSQATRMTISS